MDTTSATIAKTSGPQVKGKRSRGWPSFETERRITNNTATCQPGMAPVNCHPIWRQEVISPRQCVADAVAWNDGTFAGDEGIQTWISELVWREFYAHVLVGFPRVSMHRAFREDTEAVKWRHDEQDFQAWCDGNTGYPIVDAGMRQLNRTGWMHNRLRMVVAMFLSKHLLLDWRWGERYFMQRLVDGDLAANNGGWQWSASTGTDAAPYFRIFNPFSQSKRFDEDGRFIKKFCPELESVPAPALHDPDKLAAGARGTIDQLPGADRGSKGRAATGARGV